MGSNQTEPSGNPNSRQKVRSKTIAPIDKVEPAILTLFAEHLLSIELDRAASLLLSGRDSIFLDEAARLQRAWPLPTERGVVQWSRLPVGALLKEAAREAAKA